MLNRTDLLTLATDTRDLIGEETAALWPSSRVYRAINDEVSRLARKAIDINCGYFETYKDYTAAETLTLPNNCYIVRSIEAQVDSVWYPVPWIGAHNRTQYQSLSTTPELPLAVRFVGNALVVEGYAAASSYRVRYARMPAAMIGTTLASATSTTFVVNSGPPSHFDDVYIGDTYAIMSGTGIGQWRECTDYVASTHTWTVATWTDTPDATSTVCTLLPEPLDKWSDLVAMGAAIRLLGRRRDTELTSQLFSIYTADLDDMMKAIGQRQTNEPQRINYIPDGSE